jgi:hypothetical protein
LRCKGADASSHLVPEIDSYNERLAGMGQIFNQEYRISKLHGERFVDVTNDNNLIHRKATSSRRNDRFQDHPP